MPERVLIIDQLNLFFRSYIVNPSLSKNGDPIGGLMGSIKSLQKVVRETSPDKESWSQEIGALAGPTRVSYSARFKS